MIVNVKPFMNTTVALVNVDVLQAVHEDFYVFLKNGTRGLKKIKMKTVVKSC
jgi:hypothetical protein